VQTVFVWGDGDVIKSGLRTWSWHDVVAEHAWKRERSFIRLAWLLSVVRCVCALICGASYSIIRKSFFKHHGKLFKSGEVDLSVD
jgi:hypothetical protein